MKAFNHAPRIGRSRYDQTAPGVVAALRALGKAVDDSGLDKSLTELIELRASQINGCAFCVQYHLNVARERAALAWAEALTLMSGNTVSDAVYAELQEQFSEPEIAFLTAAVGAINVWNRIAGALHFAPPPGFEPAAAGDSR